MKLYSSKNSKLFKMSQSLEEHRKITNVPKPSENRNSHSFINSYDSLDSGYLSFTPQSNNHGSSYRFKLSLSPGKRLCRSQSKLHPYKLNPKVNICKSFDYNSHSLQDDSKIHYLRSHKMELRSHKKKNFHPTSSLDVSTQGYTFDVPSSQPLATVLLTPFANNYTNNKKKSKLVISQSTPCILSSETVPTPFSNVTLSPINYKISPTTISVNQKKFKNLSISECISISKYNKPIRLDFSKHAILSSFKKQRATPDCTGKESVDILKLLGEKSYHPRIVSKILSYLNPQDLCAASIVSKSWQRICNNDVKTQERRLKYIILKQCSKENFLFNKSKLEDVQTSPKSRYPRRGLLTAVPTNLLQTPKIHLTPSSPPVSPSKVIFHSFVKVNI